MKVVYISLTFAFACIHLSQRNIYVVPWLSSFATQMNLEEQSGHSFTYKESERGLGLSS